MSRRLLPVLALAILAGCSSGATDDEDTGDSADSALSSDWTVLGAGVAYKDAGSGPGVFIGYGGYSVKDAWACAWTSALHQARLEALGIGHLYCVRGPRDPGYAGREIANTKLGAHLLAGPAANAPVVLVAAHSSGHYVAAELFGQILSDPDDRIRGKIFYADLDGGSNGLDSVRHAMKGMAFVWAEDTAIGSGRSANASGMQAAASAFGAPSVRVKVDRSGCHAGAKWCLHDLVITSRPHDPDRFDLQDDYSDFNGRAVQTQWVDAIADRLGR